VPTAARGGSPLGTPFCGAGAVGKAEAVGFGKPASWAAAGKTKPNVNVAKTTKMNFPPEQILFTAFTPNLFRPHYPMGNIMTPNFEGF
jgi:hypothetical protein